MTPSDNLSALQQLILNTIATAKVPVSSGILAKQLDVGRSTIKRHIEVLLYAEKIVRHGTGRGTRYTAREQQNSLLSPHFSMKVNEPPAKYLSQRMQAPQLLEYLNSPLTIREITGYDRSFVDDYIPNQTFLLPKELAHTLMEEGKMIGQQPAGTYARKVLEQLLIDLS